MAATRLALSMDESVVERARRLAVARNTSISRLFVSFVCLMEQTSALADGQLPPLTKRALGLAKGCVSDDWDYRDVLADALMEKGTIEDYEDDIQQQCALQARCAQIFTRNPNHYDSSIIAVLPPSAFM